MWFTVFLVLMMIVHGPYFKVNSHRVRACSQRRCGESQRAKFESVIGRPQNTTKNRAGEKFFFLKKIAPACVCSCCPRASVGVLFLVLFAWSRLLLCPGCALFS